MAAWLDEVLSEEPLLNPGHAACAGCVPAVNMRHVLDTLAATTPEKRDRGRDSRLLLDDHRRRLAGATLGVSVFLTPFASAAAEASGIKAAMRLRGIDTHVVVWGGDGSTNDIGFSGVSAAAERNEDLIYILNDNEAYMNTGVQKSGGTPEGAWTTTTPAATPREGTKKDIDRIMAAHGIPYVATLAAGSVPMLKDFRAKVARAAEISGFRFLHVLGACPPGWRYPTDQSVEIVRQAVESRYFPLLEVAEGEWQITYRPRKPLPVSDFLSTQGRFAHLSPEQVDQIQRHLDERWNLLSGLEPVAV